MKRMILRTAAIAVAAAVFLPVTGRAISAEKAVVMDAVTGEVLYERRAGERSLIASTTKIMTALVVCQRCNLLEQVKIPKEAVGVEGSSMYLQAGEVLTVQELLYGLMLRSGNDAAVALAIHCGGSVEAFAALMNETARELGLTGSHFVNPNGLDAPEHYSCARDLAVLACHAMEHPAFAQTVSTKQVRVGERSLTNHNKLLWRMEGAEGVKTGYTRAAGRILVSSAQRQGRRLVCVTINDPDDWNDHMELMNRGFSRLHLTRLVSKGESMGRGAVLGGQQEQVPLLARTEAFYPLTEQEQVEIVLPKQLYYAPVVRGAPAGTACIRLGNTTVATVELVFGETVEQQEEEKKPLWRRILGG